jgi:hypothetical protein
MNKKPKITFDCFDCSGIAGAFAVFVGLWWIWPPLALITFGAATTYLSYELSKQCRS